MTIVERLQARGRRNAYNRWLGIRLIAAEGGRAEIEADWRAEFASSEEQGSTHVGILATLIDTCCCYAATSQTRRLVTTVDLCVDHHATGDGVVLRISARTMRSGRRIATVDARVVDGTGLLLASGRGTFMHLDFEI